MKPTALVELKRDTVQQAIADTSNAASTLSA